MRPLVASPGWTREEDELLLALALSGTSVVGMAKRLHRSRAAVYHRAGKLKIVLAKSRRAMSETKPFNVFAVPPQLEFRPSDRKILIRNEDISLQGFLSEARLRRHRSIFQGQQVQLATSSDKLDFGK